MTTLQTIFALLLGAAVAAPVIGIARWQPQLARLIYGGGLIGAALIYVGFALFGAHGSGWLPTEAIGVLAYGSFGVLGLRGSTRWLSAGWALHPVWDIALHLAGPGSDVVPGWYSVACLSTDLIIAAEILVRGLPEPATPTRSATAEPSATS